MNQHDEQRLRELTAYYDSLNRRIKRTIILITNEKNPLKRKKMQAELRSIEQERNTVQDKLEAYNYEEATEIKTSTQKKASTLHNLPHQTHVEFFGREEEIELICGLLAPYPHSRVSIIEITGVGGAGKSTLALEIAHRYVRSIFRMPEDGKFHAVIWISAKNEILSTDGVLRNSTYSKSLDDVLSVIATTLGYPGLVPNSIKDKYLVVRDLLASSRCLIIVDNYDTIDDPEIFRFISELPSPSKGIITSRKIIQIGKLIELRPLQEGDANKLISEQCDLHGLFLSGLEKDKLFEVTNGLPLAIIWCISQLSLGIRLNTLLQNATRPSSDLLKYIFQSGLVRLQNTVGHEALLALALFEGGSNLGVWQSITGYRDNEYEFELAVAEIIKLSFVMPVDEVYKMLPITTEYLNYELNQNPILKSKLQNNFVTYYLNLLSQSEISRSKTPRELSLLGDQVRDIINATSYAFQNKDFQSVFKFVDALTAILWPLGYWNDWLMVLDYGILASRSLNNREKEAWYMKDKSWVHIERGELDEAYKLAKSAIALLNTKQYTETLVSCIRILGLVAQKRGKKEESMKYFLTAIKMLEEQNNGQQLASTLSNTAEMLLELEGPTDKALSYIERSKQLLEPVGDSWRLARTYCLLGDWHSKHNDFSRAKQCYQKALSFNENVSVRRNDVYVDVMLGETWIYIQENKLREATSIVGDLEKSILNGLGVSRLSRLQKIKDVLVNKAG